MQADELNESLTAGGPIEPSSAPRVSPRGAKVLREKSHMPVILACGLSALCSLALIFAVQGAPDAENSAQTVTIYQWLSLDPAGSQPGTPGSPAAAYATTPPVNFSIAFRVDSLSATMLAMLTFVATLVAIYASGYMHGERGYWRFFTAVASRQSSRDSTSHPDGLEDPPSERRPPGTGSGHLPGLARSSSPPAAGARSPDRPIAPARGQVSKPRFCAS